MIKLRNTIAVAGVALSLASIAAQAQDLGLRPLRYGHTSGWHYDNRDDHRDYPTNGFFPGNFSADPSTAPSIYTQHARNSERSVLPYPSQVVIGATPHRPGCLRLRSHDPASGTNLGRDGLRHRC